MRQIRLPLSPRAAWRLIGGAIAVLLLFAAGVWAVAERLPDRLLLAVATQASAAGMTVRHVDIAGARHLPRLAIYQEVLEGGSDSMWLINLREVRARLQALPWVADAEVGRHWPDRISVKVTERQPAALWQEREQMVLIDRAGEVLPVADLAEFAGLPLLVGSGARPQAGGFLRMLGHHPDIAGQMEAAIWIGDRRWDLRMKSGETISLPEGAAAAAALQRFADLDRETPLLGRGFQRFDLRIPGKMVVRVDKDPGQPLKPRQPAPRMEGAGLAPADGAHRVAQLASGAGGGLAARRGLV